MTQSTARHVVKLIRSGAIVRASCRCKWRGPWRSEEDKAREDTAKHEAKAAERR